MHAIHGILLLFISLCDQHYPHHPIGAFFYFISLMRDDVVNLPAVILMTTRILIKKYILSAGMIADITALGVVMMSFSLVPRGRGLVCLGY